MQNNAVCIVGQSGSWKSTVGYIVAGRLGFRYLDLGKIWRIVGAKVLQHGGDPNDERACLEVADKMVGTAQALVAVSPDDLLADRLVASMGATPGQLLQPGVGQATAQSTVHISVRRAVAEAVRALYWEAGTVAIGRPFTYREVFPHAYLRVMLYGELQQRAANNREGETLDEVAARDRLDGVDEISTQELLEVGAAYNMSQWELVDLARAIATLAWQRSPVPIARTIDSL